MRSSILFYSAMMAAAVAIPGAAWAGDGRIGFSSSASATVTVVIPPLQAGIDARNSGAVGLWTLTSNNDGLLLRLPDALGTGETSSFDVFRTSGNVFDVSLPGEVGFHLASSARTERNGLMRQSYVLSNDGVARRDPLQVLIRGI